MQAQPPRAHGTSWSLAETLLIAALGGGLFRYLGLPAGLVSGSVIAVAIAAVAGRPMRVPASLTRLVLMLVGVALGSVVTPETLRGLAAYPASIAILVVGTLSILAGTAAYLRYVHGWDPLSATLGASPGALSQVMAISAESKVDIRAIAIVQTLRVIVLAALLPLGMMSFAGPLPSSGGTVSAPDPTELAILLAVSALSAYLLYRTRFPGAWLFGAMMGSAVLHGTGLLQTGLPAWAANAAMVALGAVAGSRVAGTSARDLMGFLLAAFGSIAVSAAIAGAFALLTILFLPLRPADVVVAYAPGAQETMMLLALALHLDPIFIGAHHLARFLLVSLTLPVVARLVVRRTQGGPGGDV